MEGKNHELPQQSERRRRRPRSKIQIFKESYLPVIIAGLAVVMIIVFIIGSISRTVSNKKAEAEANRLASESAVNAAKLLDEEAHRLLDEAEYLASGFDMAGAVSVLDTFSGDMANFPDLVTKRAEYVQAQSEMVEYTDLAAIPNLTFQLLIADPQRAFADETYGSSYSRNFITVKELNNILQQLYDNGYILVNLRDLVTTTTNEAGQSVYTMKPLYLPAGKKPVMLTETNVNYYTYMIDGNDDGLPDKDGAGFASRLIVDASGNIINEMVDADGNTVTGAFDLVPILDAFIAQHPDFSLRGAKATLAVSGYDGLFGYRTNPGAKEKFGEEARQKEVTGAKSIAEALRASGYEIACYTYDNTSYGDSSATEIEADLKYWNEEVTPILGSTDMLVYALNSDIGDSSAYSGEKYDVLKAAGFRFFLGTSFDGTPWASVTENYVRQNRIPVTGADLISNPQYYAAMFDATKALDSDRPK